MRTNTKKYFEFHYTSVVTFKDNSKQTLELKQECIEDYKEFKKKVADWDRQGNNMKTMTGRVAVSKILGYDYYITEKQEEINKKALFLRKEEVSLDGFLAWAKS